MTDSAAPTDHRAATPRKTFVLDHLIGPHRGTRQVLVGDRLRIGTASDAEVHFQVLQTAAVALHHATLQRQGSDYQLNAEPGARVDVNGASVATRTLAPGDVLRFGVRGPVARFRRVTPRRQRYKSVGEVVEDCIECARADGATRLGQAARLLKAAPAALIMQTAPWARAGLVMLLVALVGATALLLL
jgi:hypothetical protein